MIVGQGKKLCIELIDQHFSDHCVSDKYLGLIKSKIQNAVPPAKRAAQHFGFWI